MKINQIDAQIDAYISCQSIYYRVLDSVEATKTYTFSVGPNFLLGEIDSGNWAVSYILSMYPSEKNMIFHSNINVNGKPASIKSISQSACYMDISYPLFSSKKSVYNLIRKGIKRNHLPITAEEVCELFLIDSQRATRPVKAVGTEQFKCMAAIGYVHNKTIFCFPWLSRTRYDNYHNHMPELCEILEKLEVISIIPIGQSL